jgi:HK97 family phage prohead protease
VPYYISDKQADCSGWATVKEETDGRYTTIGCHDTKQDAIDQMVAASISEDLEPGGEVSTRELPENYRPALAEDVSEGHNTPRSKMKEIERRTYVVRDIEAREAEGSMRLAGYAAVFNESSVPLPFNEVIAPGAFRKTLTETPDVRLLINHDGLPLARTKNGTLSLSEDERGLYFDAELADTTEARDLWTLVQRGDVDQMSFAFRVIRQKWSEDRKNRTLTEVSLADGDVSVVTYPAYPTTTVEARDVRALDGESLLVVQAVLDKISESYDYLAEAKMTVEQLLSANEVVPDDEMPMDPEAPVEAGRSISLRLAQAIVNQTN